MTLSLGAPRRQRAAARSCFLFIALLIPFLGGSERARAQQLSPEAQEYLERGRAAMTRNQYQEAIAEFRHVLKTTNACLECYFQLTQAYQKLGAHKDAAEAARKALEIAPDNRSRAMAHNALGVEISALLGHGKIHNDEAEREFRAALQLDPNDNSASYNLGAELMMEMRDAEGISVLLEYVKRVPDGKDAKLARALIENPRRARESFAPADFALVTKDGEYVTLEEIKGKVVLLDFWATWCKPCEAALPALQHLSKRYAKDQFVLVSISVDQDDQAWQNFMASHRMDWPQAIDRDFKLRQMFNIKSYPTYVLIDTEGIMRSYVIGSGFESAAQLDDAVLKLVKNVRKVEKVEKAAAGAYPPPVTQTVPVRLPPSDAVASDPKPPVRPAALSPSPVAAPIDIEKPATPAPATSSVAHADENAESLMVTSNPDGADIYVDQNFVGNAPATLKLKAGKHNIRVTQVGFHPWTRDVTAQPGSDARLTATLTKTIPGSIRGRVLWNEQPMADVQVFAKECGPSTPKSGPATTDAQGHFAIADVPDARVCLEVHPANFQVYWASVQTVFDVAPGKETTAPDTFLCKLYEPKSPKAGEMVMDSRPVLKWDRYPEAVGYSVQVWRVAPNYVGVFRRGDREPRLDANSVQVDVDMSPGEYFWRVDAYNRGGHIIGCNYPVKFRIGGGELSQR
jgi:thiol-disulfide isomerase/thioredoxin/Tfp pilus assembly protein PilF